MFTVEQALEQERSKIDFQPRKISEFLYGPKEYAEMREKLDKSDAIPHDFNIFNRGRVQILKQSVRDFPFLVKNAGTDLSDNSMVYTSLAFMNQMPGVPHVVLFMKCIEFMGTEEQKKEYLEKCRNFQIVGTYAQTQMGHGSDVSSLLTTATFNKDKDEFIIQTGSINAIKYWNGDLGIFATHALVMAQLIVDGKNYGVQPFIVPIRDANMKLLPGIQAGDIGPKIGYAARDNGYMFIKKVPVPRKNLLGRFITVQKCGNVKTIGNPKVASAAIMEGRKLLTFAVPKIYASAITIATKYSIFRKQFKNEKKEQIKIMDYQLQQQKIIERIAQYFAITVAGNKIRNLATQNAKRVIEKGDFSLMQETHICLSLGKSFFSELVYDGMEICRKACGGHGFSQYSGFVSLINQYAANITHQGENTVLYLQIAKNLFKNYRGLAQNVKIQDESVKYLSDFERLLSKKCGVDEPQKWTIQDIKTILAQSVIYLLQSTSQQLLNSKGMNQLQFFNKISGITLRDIAVMHSAYYCMSSLKETVDRQTDKRIKGIAESLCLLFGVNFLATRGVAAIQGGFLAKQQLRSLNDLKQILLAKLRPDVMGIVDGFGIPDKYIRSELIYGNPYENFLRLARECDINKTRMPSVNIILNIKDHLHRANPKL